MNAPELNYIGDLNSVWNTFIDDYWQKRPVSFPTYPGAPPFSSAQLFDLAVNCCQSPSLSRVIGPVMILGEQEAHNPRSRGLLPEASDGSFEGYNARIASTVTEAPFYLLLSNIEVGDFSLWWWGCEFLRNVYRRVGMNRLGVHFLLFIGNYDITPLGVHQDAGTFFHFPIIGTKCLRTWPAEAGSAHPGMVGQTKYDKYLDGSELLVARPGGAFYMPTSYWHIGESSGGQLTVSLALSLFTFGDLSIPLGQYLLSPMANSLSSPIGADWHTTIPFDPDNIQASTDTMPEALSESAAQVRRRVSDEAISVLWMKLCTGYGFLNPSMHSPGRMVTPREYVRLRQDYPLAYKVNNRQTVIAAGGHLLNSDGPDVSDMIELLKRRNMHQVAELTRSSGIERSRILDFLCATGALEIVEP